MVDMSKILYLRNVPDEVCAQLEELASREGLPVATFAVRELTAAAQRARNAAIFAAVPVGLGIDPEEIVKDIEAGRDERTKHLDPDQ
jgi:hypothetical protein